MTTRWSRVIERAEADARARPTGLWSRATSPRCSTMERRPRQVQSAETVEFAASPEGEFTQRTELTADQRHLLKALGVPEPPRFGHITPARWQPAA
jgi:hypothetical protein